MRKCIYSRKGYKRKLQEIYACTLNAFIAYFELSIDFFSHGELRSTTIAAR